jgi:hypothetical protein
VTWPQLDAVGGAQWLVGPPTLQVLNALALPRPCAKKSSTPSGSGDHGRRHRTDAISCDTINAAPGGLPRGLEDLRRIPASLMNARDNNIPASLMNARDNKWPPQITR